MSFEDERRNVSEKANIIAIVRRRNPMKVLLFLHKNKKLYYIQEIADLLDMCEATVSLNLHKLNDANLVELVQSNVDKRLRFWKIANEELVEKAIEKYKYRVSFRLARLVPYNKIYTDQLKSDKRFVEACQYYGLSVSEGISAVLSCPKIGSETHSGRSIIWRVEQGFDEPEKTHEQILKEAMEAIG